MPRRLRIVAVAATALALVIVTGAIGRRWWTDSRRSDLERATSYAPRDVQRLSWTDWAGVRDRVGARLDASSSGPELADLLEKGYDADLTSASALVESAPVLQDRFGFSPANADWELFAQAEDGAAVIVAMPEDTDFDELAANLERNGFGRPASDDGVWDGAEALPALGAGLTPELQYVALDAEDHLVLTSDTAGYLEQTVDELGDGELPDGVRQVVEASGDALSASVYDGDHACSALAMGHADASDQETADRLVAQVGEVSPMTGFAMSAQPGGDVRVAMAFADEDQARANADARAALAAGAAPGQGGDFADRFTVDSATADGSLVTLELRPRPGAYVLSDLSSGPVLFATC